MAAGAAALAGVLAMVGPREPPAVSGDMKRVLASMHLRMREELVALRTRGHNARRRPVGLIVSGLARNCDVSEAAANLMEDCNAGVASLAVLLQHYEPGRFPLDERWVAPSRLANESLPFAWGACAATLLRAANESSCELVLGRQWFEADARAQALCDGRGAIRNVGRAAMQALAAGRAYEWHGHFLGRPSPGVPPHAYVRGRLDGVLCAPRTPAATLATLRGVLVGSSVQDDALTGAQFIGDIYGMMSADVAPAYFGAWRSWLPLNCSSVCYAGQGSSAVDVIKPALAKACTGEIPLSRYLIGSGVRASHRAKYSGQPFFKFRPGEAARGAPKLAAAYSAFRAKLCAPCWPACQLPALRGKSVPRYACGRRPDRCAVYELVRAKLRCSSAWSRPSTYCMMQNAERTALPPGMNWSAPGRMPLLHYPPSMKASPSSPQMPRRRRGVRRRRDRRLARG